MGLLNNALPFCLIVWGQTHVASGLAAILNATTPLSTIIAAHFLTADEKITARKMGGITMGLAGVVTLFGPAALKGATSSIFAQGAIICGTISYALAAIFGRRFSKQGVDPLVTATGQLTGAALILLPLTLFIDRPWTLPAPSATVMLAILGLASFSTALSYVVYFRLLASSGATNVLLVTLLVPVTAITLGTLVLGEQLELRSYAGMLLIWLSLVIIDGRFLRFLTASRE